MNLENAVKKFVSINYCYGIHINKVDWLCVIKSMGSYYITQPTWKSSGQEYQKALNLSNKKLIYIETESIELVNFSILDFFTDNPEYLI